MQDPQNSSHNNEWLDHLASVDGKEENKTHFWGKEPSCLISNSSISSRRFTVGNGTNIYNSTIIPALESAQCEIIFVTCFWARSSALDQLSATLVKLSTKANSRPNGIPKLRVRLCFSSCSLIQKLSHTSSPAGHIYPPSKWQSLGLPPPSDLSGLDLQVKSLFFLPFSVMHPKFVIIDRQRALFPSCNLSYESWLECCLPVTGPVVTTLVDFWHNVWARNDFPPLPVTASEEVSSTPPPSEASPSCTTILLPSPHHRSPHFRPFSTAASPPLTPLNTYLLHLFATASKSIKLITPNLTSQPVIDALVTALERGVDVEVITNRRMMILEQLLTSGTITEYCVWKFRRRYRKFTQLRSRRDSAASHMEEGQARQIGKLSVGYFIPGIVYKRSHIKCTVVDEEVIVLGSGNMDRASWYTSQELGIALEGRQVVGDLWRVINGDESPYREVEWLDTVK
ncbi:hypothetical protein JMJ35_000334 [Cladonia borealis]|uniref:PLD phosphodiesterase domain-containing protein n=1 Tax=Cladonia borealis TaxID=184061 RepID=A0AA39RB39_9LECA|nr:hypothetical protein JMJ35_000334 [Cladonia borealis]